MVDGVRIAIAGGVTFVIVALLVPVARRYALRNGITDNPAPGKSHASPTPYLGGVAIALGAVACSAVLPELAVAGGRHPRRRCAGRGDRPLRRRPYRAPEHAAPGGGERGDGRGGRRCARPALRRPARLRDHRGVDRRHHELVQPARQHGRRRGLDRHRHRLCPRGDRAARGPAARGRHGGRDRRRLPRLPALQLAPGADLHGRRRFVVPRVRPRRHRLEAADAGAARGEHRGGGPARRPGGLRHDAGGDLPGVARAPDLHRRHRPHVAPPAAPRHPAGRRHRGAHRRHGGVVHARRPGGRGRRVALGRGAGGARARARRADVPAPHGGLQRRRAGSPPARGPPVSHPPPRAAGAAPAPHCAPLHPGPGAPRRPRPSQQHSRRS